jgi:hypothetical protein
MGLINQLGKYPAIAQSLECVRFLEAFDSGFPQTDPGKLPKACKIRAWPDPFSRYLDFDIGRDLTPSELIGELPEGQRYTYREVADYATSDLNSQHGTDVWEQLYNLAHSEENLEHFRVILGKPYEYIVSDEIIQSEFLTILHAGKVNVTDNNYVNMLRGTYLAGYLPMGWTGSYPDAYGLLVGAKD